MIDAIVLAGGAARRLGGADKPAVDVGGRPLLAHVVDAAAATVGGSGSVVVVGPRRALPATSRAVRWCREDPPGGGPVAALAAALPSVRGDVVLVLAADLPAIAPALPRLVSGLADAPAGAGVAALADPDGRVNFLAAAWRTQALRGAVAAVGASPGTAMRALIATVEVITVPDTGGWGRDCDTWEDVEAARRRAAGPADDSSNNDRGARVTNPLDAWTAELAEALGVDPAALDRALLLDVARDAAHGVARPAAPLTTFLVGLAAGLRGGGADAVAEAAAVAQRLALAHAPEPEPEPEA